MATMTASKHRPLSYLTSQEGAAIFWTNIGVVKFLSVRHLFYILLSVKNLLYILLSVRHLLYILLSVRQLLYILSVVFPIFLMVFIMFTICVKPLFFGLLGCIGV